MSVASATRAFAVAAAVVLPLTRGEAQQVISSTATATFETAVGMDSVASNAVQTVIVRAQAGLQITLTGPRTARIGELVTYRIEYRNLSTTAPLSGAELTSRIPAGLSYASATPVATAAATVLGRVVRWPLGDVAPDSRNSVDLTLRVDADVMDTVRVGNSVSLTAMNSDTVTSEADLVTLVGASSKRLALTKTVGQLEAGLGESVPFTLVVHNVGTRSLNGVVVHDMIPEGTRLMRASVSGADSMVASARTLQFFLRGILAPDAKVTIRYTVSVLSANASALSSAAYATSEDLAVRSTESTATFRVRTNFAMENRVVIGKVWVDRNGNGVQDIGDEGVSGVDVWTDDGEIATTDADGRFSYRNVRPGQHGFRLDPNSLPVEYGLSGSATTNGLVTRDATGWTTPSVGFRLLARTGRVSSIRRIGPSVPEAPPAQLLASRAQGNAVHLVARQATDRTRLTSTNSATNSAPVIGDDSIPDASGVDVGTELELTLEAPATGWPGEASYLLPLGWTVAVPSSRGVAVPRVGRDRTGAPALFWRMRGAPRTPLVVRLRPTLAGALNDTVRIPALRTADARTAEVQRAFLDGAPVRFFSPRDGQVLQSDRVFVGVRGEPGVAVSLFDGDSLIGRATTRPDGVHDFIAVALAPGPHRLRVRMQNAFQREVWDSMAVHVTGAPAQFVPDRSRFSLIADGQTIEEVRVAVLDAWGVPVVNHPEVTVTATGAEPANVDANVSSVGVQVQADDAGMLAVRVRAGRIVTEGVLSLQWMKVRGRVAFDVLPASGPLFLTAVGRVGVGASPDAFGAMTARGRISGNTRVTATYDSRRLDVGRDVFGRVVDPLEQTQYPVLGDASTQRAIGTSRYALAARVERGYDWLAVGDISTSGFANGLTLSGYRRALPGIAARVATGAVEWQGFGSATTQSLQQLQMRGAGMSGPYALRRNVRGGTEQVSLEFRALENASRVVSRQVLERFVDYEIDYATGTLLFKQPVPATDGYGNPVFIVVLYEAESGGPKQDVWGVRGSMNATPWIPASRMDTLRLGMTWVHETRMVGGLELLGADFRVLRLGALDLMGESSMSRTGDSSGVAASLSGRLALFRGAATITGAWMTAGREFANPANPSIQGGTHELRVGAELAHGTQRFKLSHERQQFRALGLERMQSIGTITQPLGSRAQVQASLTGERFSGTTAPNGTMGSELKLQYMPTPRLTLTSEGRQQFKAVGPNAQPSYVGAGASLKLARDLSIELRHRQVFLTGDSASYGLTDVGVRTRVGANTEAYSKYQIAGISGAQNAALVGLRNRWTIRDAGALNLLAERRKGIGRALAIDPVRALPFLQFEEDYLSIGVGAEYFRPSAPYRASARAEFRDGDIRSTALITAVGDISIRRSLALLSRHEVMRNEQVVGGALQRGHRYATLWGMALRPVQSNALNVLGKVEWIDEDRGDGGGVFVGPRAEERAILAGEAIWQPRRASELALRYAFRSAAGRITAADETALRPRSSAHFIGARATQRLLPLLEVRTEARLLRESISGAHVYDLAPSLAVFPQRTLEVVGGYRMGSLRDPDFAVNGGRGWFITVGARMTEGGVASAAEFWRQRVFGVAPQGGSARPVVERQAPNR